MRAPTPAPAFRALCPHRERRGAHPCAKGEILTAEELRRLYIDLMRKCVIGLVYKDLPLAWDGDGVRPFDRQARETGRDWPAHAQSMIGHKRRLQLQRAAEFVIEKLAG